MSSCSLQKICICRDAASSFVRLEDCVPSPASPIPALWQSCARPSQTPSVCTMSPKGGYTLRILRVRLYINCLASKLPARGQGVPTSAWLPQPFYTRMHARVHARPNCKRFNQFGRACISIPDTERPRACTFTFAQALEYPGDVAVFELVQTIPITLDLQHNAANSLK
jgi:hypothetical protein